MTEIEALIKLKECCDFLRDELKGNNLALVYEFACIKWGHVVVSAASTILLSGYMGESKHGKSTQ